MSVADGIHPRDYDDTQSDSEAAPHQQSLRRSARLARQPVSHSLDDLVSLRSQRRGVRSSRRRTPCKKQQRQRHIMAEQDLNLLIQALAGAGLGSSLQPFDGRTPVDFFLAELTSVCEDMGNQENLCIRILRRALRGRALLFFQEKLAADQQANHVATLADWKQRLKAEFTKAYDVQCSEIRARKMKEGESATDYVNAIKMMAKQVDPPFSDAQTLEVLIDNVLPAYREAIQHMDPSSVDKFQKKLSKLIARKASSAPATAVTLTAETQHPHHQSGSRFPGAGRGRPFPHDGREQRSAGYERAPGRGSQHPGYGGRGRGHQPVGPGRGQSPWRSRSPGFQQQQPFYSSPGMQQPSFPLSAAQPYWYPQPPQYRHSAPWQTAWDPFQQPGSYHGSPFQQQRLQRPPQQQPQFQRQPAFRPQQQQQSLSIQEMGSESLAVEAAYQEQDGDQRSAGDGNYGHLVGSE